MEGDVGGIFSEAPDWKSLFLLKIKIKQNSGCPNKEYNSIFEHINHITRAYPRSQKKKSALIDDYENIIAYWKNPSKGEQMWFVPNTFGESEGRYHLQENFDIFTLIEARKQYSQHLNWHIIVI